MIINEQQAPVVKTTATNPDEIVTCISKFVGEGVFDSREDFEQMLGQVFVDEKLAKEYFGLGTFE